MSMNCEEQVFFSILQQMKWVINRSLIMFHFYQGQFAGVSFV